MRYKEVEKQMMQYGAEIHQNDWYTGKPMYELYSKVGEKKANLQYRTVWKIIDNHETNTRARWGTKIISIIKE